MCVCHKTPPSIEYANREFKSFLIFTCYLSYGFSNKKIPFLLVIKIKEAGSCRPVFMYVFLVLNTFELIKK